MNKVILIGNLGKEPTLAKIGTGKSVSNFTLATNEVYVKGDDKKEVTYWHNIVVFGSQADACAKMLTKGDRVAVFGKVTYRTYEKDGERKYITEIVADNVEFQVYNRDLPTPEDFKPDATGKQTKDDLPF